MRRIDIHSADVLLLLHSPYTQLHIC